MPDVLIGVAGYAGAGKDALADLLVAHFGFTKISFADPMREIAAAIDPIIAYVKTDDPNEDEILRYTDVVEMFGYDESKMLYPEMRRFLQRLGTEGGRGILGQDVWVNEAMRRAQAYERVVFADMRFRNEAEAIRAAGGRTIRVERPGVSPANDHASEHDLAKWSFDLHVNNNGTFEDMIGRLDGFFARHIPRVLRIS